MDPTLVVCPLSFQIEMGPILVAYPLVCQIETDRTLVVFPPSFQSEMGPTLGVFLHAYQTGMGPTLDACHRAFQTVVGQPSVFFLITKGKKNKETNTDISNMNQSLWQNTNGKCDPSWRRLIWRVKTLCSVWAHPSLRQIRLRGSKGQRRFWNTYPFTIGLGLRLG